MIINRKPLTLAEVKSYIPDLEEKRVLADYLKTFSEIDFKKSQTLKDNILALNNLKISEEKIIKIVDFLPKDMEDLSKIFLEVSLTEEESNAIIDAVKN